MTTNKYAEAGVDFELEHDIVGIMRKAGELTEPNTDDLKDLGISFPDDAEDFSGGLEIDIEGMYKRGVKKLREAQAVDGPGTKPIVHALYRQGHFLGNLDWKKLAKPGIDSILMCVNDEICSEARPVA